MTALVIIPARFGSTRLVGKLLLDETGKPLIQHTYEAAKSTDASDVVIATDDDRIRRAAQGFGARAIMTAAHHASGTARIAEAFAQLATEGGAAPGIIINLQGDEPEIDPENINHLIHFHAAHKDLFFVSTLACPFAPSPKTGAGSPMDPACVKVIATPLPSESKTPAPLPPVPREARYFSRAPIPYPRATEGIINDPTACFLHLGVYAFTPDSLARFTELPASPLEEMEKLEQLRILDNGHRIGVGLVDSSAPGVDTPEDYAAFVKRATSEKMMRNDGKATAERL